MSISEEMKKILEGSEEGKQVLAEMEEAAKAGQTIEDLKKAALVSAEENKKLRDNMFDPAVLAAIAASDNTEREPKPGNTELDFDNMDMKGLHALITKQVQDILKGVETQFSGRQDQLMQSMQGYVLEDAKDRMRRFHKSTGREENFEDVILPAMLEAGKKNPKLLLWQAYDESIGGLDSEGLRQEKAKAEAEAKIEAEKQASFAEKGGAALAGIEGKEYPSGIKGVEAVAKEMGIAGNIPAE